MDARVPYLRLRLVLTPVSAFAFEAAFMWATADWTGPLAAWLPLIDALAVTAWTFVVAGVLVLFPVLEALNSHLEEQADERRTVEDGMRRQALEGQVRSGLEMARDEAQARAVLSRAMAQVVPAYSSQLLLADSSQAHLRSHPLAGDPTPACRVDCPADCPTARTGSSLAFTSADAIDACPWLVASGNTSTVLCTPVSASGRVVGVVQLSGTGDLSPADLRRKQVVTREFGARLSVLRAMEAAERAANRDPLTGLLNRRSFEARATRRMANAMHLAVVMVDIDHFKALNDTHGHAVGDRALMVFARLLHEHFSQRGLVARFGGEEFVVLLTGDEAREAHLLTEELRAIVSRRCQATGVPAMTASFGIADQRLASDLPSLIAAADAALYQAKHRGRDRVVQAGLGEVEAA